MKMKSKNKKKCKIIS